MSSRELWLDIAKGVGIALVVAYHTLEGIKNSFDQVSVAVVSVAAFFTMWLMPMFFIVSGMLARRSLARATRADLGRRTLNWFYIYLIWSLIIYAVRLAMNSITNTSMNSYEILFILWDPVPTIWFIYALLLSYVLTYLLRNLPAAWVVAAALMANMANEYFQGWFPGSIFERVAWIYLFYALGYFYGGHLTEWLAKRWLTPPVSLAFWLVLVLAVAIQLRFPFYLKPLAAVVLTLGFLAQCRYLAGQWRLATIAHGLAYLGSISLFIYLTHFPVPGACRLLLTKTGIYSDLMLVVMAVAVALVVGMVGQRLGETRWGRYLYAMPGLGRA